MFNTAINHFFQSFNNPIVHWFLNFVSLFGTTYFVIFVLLSLIGGVNFRKGFLVTYILAWVMLATAFFKDYIDYPRPLAVDNTLNSFGIEKTVTNLVPLQPKGFFELFSDELLYVTRQSDIERTGFPSGHTSSTVAIWISLALLLRKKWLWVFSILFVVLMMISRLFLARHYLGDVTGGLILGLTIVGIIYFFISKYNLESPDGLRRSLVTMFLFPLILIPMYKFIPSFESGCLLGISLAFLIILKIWKNPIVAAQLWKKVCSVLIFFSIFVALFFFGKTLHLQNLTLSGLLYYTASSLMSILLSTYIVIKLRLVSISQLNN